MSSPETLNTFGSPKSSLPSATPLKHVECISFGHEYGALSHLRLADEVRCPPVPGSPPHARPSLCVPGACGKNAHLPLCVSVA